MSSAVFPQLQAFLAVARHQSFTAAAREMGVTRSALSQAVSQLEERSGVVLLIRTTRNVALTDAGQRLVDSAGPALAQALASLAEVSAKPGEVVGRLRLSVPRAAVPFVIAPVLPAFRARHPRVEVEVTVEERLIDLVAEGFDAGIRHTDQIERDMVQVRLTDAFRFLVVGAPSYFARHGKPERPKDLLDHECITFRSQTTGALYAWELERGKKSWRVPVRGGVVTNDGAACIQLAEAGLGLAYAFEPTVAEALRKGTLESVMEAHAATVPGFFLYFPSSARSSAPLRSFIEVAKERSLRNRG